MYTKKLKKYNNDIVIILIEGTNKCTSNPRVTIGNQKLMNNCPEENKEYTKDCPIRLVLDRIADKWTVLIVGSLRENTKRFGVLRKEINGISQKMLTQTLRAMERDGLISRQVYPTIPPKVEYTLTDLGKSLIPILIDIQDWAANNTPKILTARQSYDNKVIER